MQSQVQKKGYFPLREEALQIVLASSINNFILNFLALALHIILGESDWIKHSYKCSFLEIRE